MEVLLGQAENQEIMGMIEVEEMAVVAEMAEMEEYLGIRVGLGARKDIIEFTGVLGLILLRIWLWAKICNMMGITHIHSKKTRGNMYSSPNYLNPYNPTNLKSKQ